MRNEQRQGRPLYPLVRDESFTDAVVRLQQPACATCRCERTGVGVPDVYANVVRRVQCNPTIFVRSGLPGLVAGARIRTRTCIQRRKPQRSAGKQQRGSIYISGPTAFHHPRFGIYLVTPACPHDITMGHNLSRLSLISTVAASGVEQLTSGSFEQFVTGNERVLVSCAFRVRPAVGTRY